MAISEREFLHMLEGCKQDIRSSQKLLYKEYYSYGLTICLHYAQTAEEAKEILNDGFIKVFLHIKRFDYDPKQPFKAWLRRILINAAIDHFRQQKKHYYHSDIEDIPQEVDLHDAGIISQLSYDEIMILVQKLSPAYRMVFNLHVVEGYKHPEIAKKLGISVGASKSNLAKAKKKLKVMVNRLNAQPNLDHV
jgi:RNA polymerase sigma-70 factor (ECF subfamily)